MTHDADLGYAGSAATVSTGFAVTRCRESLGGVTGKGNMKLLHEYPTPTAVIAVVARGWSHAALAEYGLGSKGYGPDVPIADIKADGRQTHRRVQFVTLEKAPKGETNAE